MIWELRMYRLRTGGLEAIMRRFDRLLPPLFERHGVEIRGAWTANDEDTPVFAYLMGYQSLAARESQWDAFYADPTWPVLRAEANSGGDPIVTMDIWVVRDWQLDASFWNDVSTPILRQDIVVALASVESPNRGELRVHLGMTHNQKIDGRAPILAGDVLFGPRLPAAMAIWLSKDAYTAHIERHEGENCSLTRLSAVVEH